MRSNGALRSTMVTAILPILTFDVASSKDELPDHADENGRSHAMSPSVSSELTITPARLQYDLPHAQRTQATKGLPSSASSQLAGFVGMFTGLGALVAVAFLLPLPAKFQQSGQTASEAIASSFYVVALIALVIAVANFAGLRNLPGEEQKEWRRLFGRRTEKVDDLCPDAPEDYAQAKPAEASYFQNFLSSIKLGYMDVDIGLGYLSGFVARASSVAISLFIPLFVNHYFISSGQCAAAPRSPGSQVPDEIKRNCRRAYVVAAMLTGTSQLVALLAAPIYGYMSKRSARIKFPLIFAAVVGILGYGFFGVVHSPDPASEDGTSAIFILAALIGLSQIGSIVCSLSLIAEGIQEEEERVGCKPNENRTNDDANDIHNGNVEQQSDGDESVLSPRQHDPNSSHETDPLLMSRHSSHSFTSERTSRKGLKGSIAGVYSLSGGAGILLLTKLGGFLFDSWTPSAPLFMMAFFNGVLLVCTLLAMGRKS